MKLSVITITCRENPRLAVMGRTLAAALARAPGIEQLEWLIIDERERQVSDLLEISGAGQDLSVYARVDQRLKVHVFPPLPSEHRSGMNRVPAHNSARAAGLLRASGDFVVLLNDCTVVTQDWCSVAFDVSAKGQGWLCKATLTQDLDVPANGIVRSGDHHDRLRPIPHTTVGGPCWGVPRAALAQIGGFDLAYDGQDRGHDTDAIVRLSRLGVKFVTSERAFCVRLRRTKTKTEISTVKEAFAGARNQALLNRLGKEPSRTHPLVGAGSRGVKPGAVAGGELATQPPPTPLAASDLAAFGGLGADAGLPGVPGPAHSANDSAPTLIVSGSANGGGGGGGTITVLRVKDADLAPSGPGDEIVVNVDGPIVEGLEDHDDLMDEPTVL